MTWTPQQNAMRSKLNECLTRCQDAVTSATQGVAMANQPDMTADQAKLDFQAVIAALEGPITSLQHEIKVYDDVKDEA